MKTQIRITCIFTGLLVGLMTDTNRAEAEILPICRESSSRLVHLDGVWMPPLDQVQINRGFRLFSRRSRRKSHTGVDYHATRMTPVYAASDGIVDMAQDCTKDRHCSGYGKLVKLNHSAGEMQTYYAHLSKILVKKGDDVGAGTLIGYSGSTGHSHGPHLHFELRYWSPSFQRFIPTDPLNAFERYAILQKDCLDNKPIGD